MKPQMIVSALMLLAAATTPSRAQTNAAANPPYAGVYVFGYSVAGTRQCDLSRTSYWNGRSSNGPLWPEYLSTNLGLTYLSSRNYAACGHDSAAVLTDIASFSAPANANLALYCLMSGAAIDFLRKADPDFNPGVRIDFANTTNWEAAVRTWVRNDSNALLRLYAKGARSVVVLNCPDTSSRVSFVREYGFDSPEAAQLRVWIERFNSTQAAALRTIAETKPDFRLVRVDYFREWALLRTHYRDYGFTSNDVSALGDPDLPDKSFDGPGRNYLLWDDTSYPTTRAHELMAGWISTALAATALERLQAQTTGNSQLLIMQQLKLGREYFLECSADLKKWEAVHRFTAIAGTSAWNLPTPPGPVAIFRLRWDKP